MTQGTQTGALFEGWDEEGGEKEVGREGRLVYLWLIFVDMTENHKIL